MGKYLFEPLYVTATIVICDYWPYTSYITNECSIKYYPQISYYGVGCYTVGTKIRKQCLVGNEVCSTEGDAVNELGKPRFPYGLQCTAIVSSRFYEMYLMGSSGIEEHSYGADCNFTEDSGKA